MKLHGTALSHFARKVRLLLDHYGTDYEFIDVGNVAQPGVEKYDGNPLMSVPVFQNGEAWLVESDDIARHIARSLDDTDRYRVLATDAKTLNVRAVLNGIMSNEVKLVLADRTGLDTQPWAYFEKARTVIATSLDWLEERADVFNPDAPSYLDFHLAAAWQHLDYFETAELTQPRLREIVDALNAQERIARTSPWVLKPKG